MNRPSMYRQRSARYCFSVSLAIRRIISTTSRGCSPIAVSPESMQASAPSRMALATSVASARVGRRAWCMLSSICVATITGFWYRWQARMIRF